MNFSLPTFIFSFLLLGSTFGQTLSVAEIQEDLHVLKEKIDKYHPGAYAYISPKKYQNLYDSLYASVTTPLPYMEVFHHIAPLVIALQDGHTAVQHNANVFGKKTKLIPLYVRKLNQGYFISYNCSNDTTLARGSEVYSIDEMPLEEIFDKMRAFISADNYNELTRTYYEQSDFPTYFLKYFGEKDSVKIKYRRASENCYRETPIACLNGKQIGARLVKRYKWAIRQNLKLKIVDSLTKTASIDITSFLMSGKIDFNNHKFKRTLRKDFKTIQEKGIENLIIDLRGNGGGFIPNVSRLLKYLLPEPFSLIDTLEFKKQAYFKIAPIYTILPPAALWALFPKKHGEYLVRINHKNNTITPEEKLHFNGSLYFLTNPGCYSATTFTLSLAKDKGVGTVVGEQVGGASWGSHAVNWYEFKLPNSKIRVHLPLFRLTHQLEHKPPTFFLQPDFQVGRSYEELIKNNDNVLDFTLGIIRAKAKAAK